LGNSTVTSVVCVPGLNDPGAIHLWIEEIDEDNRPNGLPRAYRLPYDTKLAEKAEAAVKASANGKPHGGRTADAGTGEGGEGQITAREVTPSSITTTGGGIPRPAVRSTRAWHAM
jgi:hypothetical protein